MLQDKNELQEIKEALERESDDFQLTNQQLRKFIKELITNTEIQTKETKQYKSRLAEVENESSALIMNLRKELSDFKQFLKEEQQDLADLLEDHRQQAKELEHWKMVKQNYEGHLELARNENEQLSKELEQSRKEFGTMKNGYKIASHDLNKEIENLRNQLNEAEKAFRKIADESNCDGAGRNLSRCNMYANEAINKLTERADSRETVSHIQGQGKDEGNE